MTRLLSLLGMSLLLSVALPVSAMAAAGGADGVQVDPDSAPAAEYALPLQDARDDAAAPTTGGGDSSPGSATGASPAFGDGISAAPTSKPATAAGDPAAKTTESSGSGSGGEVGGTSERATPGAIGDTDGVAALYAFGGAGAVLLGGAIVGLALRRRRLGT